MSTCRRSLVTLGCLSLLMLSMTAEADVNIPAPPQVPAGLSAQQTQHLSRTRETLVGQHDFLQRWIDENYAQCHDVRKDDTARLHACDKDNAKLGAKYREYLAGLTDFKHEIKTAGVARTALLRQKIARIREKIARDQQALRQVQRITTPEEFETWQKLNEDAKKDTVAETATMVIGLAGEGFTKWVKGLSARQAKALARKLEKVGATDPYVLAAVRGLASPEGKKRVEAANNLLQLAKDAVEEKKAVGEGFASTAVTMVKIGLDWGAEKYPPLKAYALLIGDFQLWAQIGYDVVLHRVSKARIDQLTALSESQLKAVKKVSQVLKGHVGQLIAAQKELAALKAGH